jgi:hypothetical protein
MINIQETKVFFYDENRRTVTVYRDFANANKWYIVPDPTLALQEIDGHLIPEFAMVEYNTTEGIQGNCSFTVELGVSPEALKAVHDNLGLDIELGQFDWLTGQAYFYYDITGREKVLNARPSMYSNNRAAFVIFLPDQEAVESFKGAFGPGGGMVSPFRIEYDLLTLSKLPAVAATVIYRSEIAFNYEKNVDIDKNIWGKERGRTETIKEYLKNSDAGDVDINWFGMEPSEEFRQRVNDWAWISLEGLVTKAVDDAMRRIGEKNGDKFSMTQVASFERTYSENQIIEWAIKASVQLPSFDAEQWKKHYKAIDTRNMVVSFNLLNHLSAEVIDRVSLKVTYPVPQSDAGSSSTDETELTGNSHNFVPGGDSSWTFTADGHFVDGKFDPVYAYEYEIFFKGHDPYKSERITNDATQVNFTTASFGTQQAQFVGSNINFEKEVDFVLIKYFFKTPTGVPNAVGTLKMMDNTNLLKAESKNYQPSNNQLTYQLTYVMKDKNKYVMGPVEVYSASLNGPIIISSPFVERQFNLMVINLPPGIPAPVTYVQIRGTYSHDWKFAPPQDEAFYEANPSWTINLVSNPSAAFVTYNGIALLKTGKQRTFTDIKDQLGFFNIHATDVPFTVTIDPSQIDWEGAAIQQVVVNIWVLSVEPQLTGDVEADQATLLVTEPFKDQQASPLFMQGIEESGTPKQYYTFVRPSGTPAKYYYDATYYHAGTKADSYVAKKTADNKLIVLPKDGTSTTRIIHQVEVEAEE